MCLSVCRCVRQYVGVSVTCHIVYYLYIYDIRLTDMWIHMCHTCHTDTIHLHTLVYIPDVTQYDSTVTYVLT